MRDQIALPEDAERAPRRAVVPLAEAARRLGHEGTGWRAAARLFPVRWPEEYLELAESAEGQAVRRMGVPDARELEADPGDLADPVGDLARREHRLVVRKHASRAILLVTARCHFYCRFCFRRADEHREPRRAEIAEALAHLEAEARGGLREVILSGGDPLVLSDERLAEILARLDAIAGLEVLRLHTRAPVHRPDRIDDALVRLLGSRGGLPTWVATHFNHPSELRASSRQALRRLIDAGVPVLNQSVLLRGVNDDPEVLAELFRGLVRARVKPYYLHHPDRAPGNAAFRVSVRRGREIFGAVRQRVSGPALPAHVIDLPDGSGKVPVETLVEVAPSRWARPDGSSAFDDVEEPAPRPS